MSSDDLQSRRRLNALEERHGGAAPAFAEPAAPAERPGRQRRAQAAGGQRGPWRRIKGMLDQGGETVPGTKVSLAGLEALLEHAKRRGDGDGKGGGLAKRILEFLATGSGPQTVGGVRIEQVDRFAKLVEQRANASSEERPNRQRRQRRDQAAAAPAAESAAVAAAVSVEGLEDWTADLAEEV